jgi:vacuolar-type H+-ATPase subunit E/Vma4
MTANDNSAESLREEILEQARDQAKEIVGQARDQADKILAAASAEAQNLRDKLIEKARADAHRRKELIESTVAVETGRFRVARIESLLESVREEVRRRLFSHEGFEYRDVLIALASLAISGMTGERFVVKLSEADRPSMENTVSEEIASRIDRPGLVVNLVFDPTMNSGGVSVEDADALQIWDNGLLQRLERMWPELRRQIALGALFVPAVQSGEESQ